MRYYHEKPTIYSSMYGTTYACNHPVYDICTLYEVGNRGLAVIQQRFNPIAKQTKWTEIDPWLTDALYMNPKFKQLFDERSAEPANGLYPTMTIRQIMWALKMKPLKKERWETAFDRRDI